MSTDTFQTLPHDHLASVNGGDFDGAACFDQIAAWGSSGAAGGAVAGIAGGTPLSVGAGAAGGLIAGAGGAYLGTKECWDGNKTPMTAAREAVTNWPSDPNWQYMGEQTP